ncbi:MAG: cell wall hydrolase [Candidatus Taylorbacteria bacterium]|nr:cell wall hydrolase [Candidatus Taylorbacteria bacterium]
MQKITVGVFAIMLAFGAFAANSAHAATASLSILYGSDLQSGATGNGATELQAFLGEQGYLNVAPTVSLGYFGGQTKAALIQYQASHNVPATGYFGPLTKNAIQQEMLAHCWLGACMTPNM